MNFIEQELNFDKSKLILDVGCGTGRHAIELAKRGYNVTGIDLSEAQLNRAREKAAMAGVTVEFLWRDARAFDFSGRFDAAIMICEGAFSLMETDEMNFAILQNVSRSLKTEGRFIFTALNALFPLYHAVQDFLNSDSNGTTTKDLSFDIMTFCENSTVSFVDVSGVEKQLATNERYFAPSELRWYLTTLEFSNIGIYGCDLGNFSRDKKLTTEDLEILVVAVK